VSASHRVAAAIDSLLDRTLRCPSRSATLHHIALDEARAAARPVAARLIGADEDEMAVVESTTHGLAVAARALPLEPGDHVVVCELEFMEVAIPWLQLPGIEVDVVPAREGLVQVADVEAAIGPRTRVLVVSSVQWTSGQRVDLAGLSRIGREGVGWLVADAIPQLGAVPIDVGETAVDVLACGGHKWLNAPFGAGLLYLRRDRREELRPPLAGYLSCEPPEGGWGAYFQTPSIRPVRDYRYVREARAWEIGGTANYPGAVGLAASLGLIDELGQDAVADHVRRLGAVLLGELDALGVRALTPREPEQRAGIVTFTTGDADRDVALMEHLLDQSVLVSVRYTAGVGGVRVSCHFFDTEEDVGRLVEEARRFL